MKIELDNNNIMVEEIEVKEDTSSDFIIPKETLDEEQVAQGTVIESCTDKYKKDDVVLFHKVIPVDVNLKYNSNELKSYWFVPKKDIICKIIT
jgi:co-chaperonin GroES (HSP10)|tara:strand:+ start:83 stop:361 length:279 start_codon:yes stop_codon:yes gene_type:complete